MVQVLTNHIGYDIDSPKTAIFQGKKEIKAVSFEVRKYDNEAAVVYTGTPVEVGEVANWKTGYYYTMRFDEVKDFGKYYVVVKAADGTSYSSFPFMISGSVLEYRTLSDCCYYFKCQRPTGEIDVADKNIRFGPGPREGERWDARGGWADATGDIGIHMSLFSRSTYFNVQEAAFSGYGFFKINDLLEEGKFPHFKKLKRRLLDEAMYGADWLMRNRSESGSFFQSKSRTSDAYCPVLTTRIFRIDGRSVPPEATTLEERLEGNKRAAAEHVKQFEDYEVSFRSGGGYAIAVLAYAARTVYPSEFSKESFIKAAVESYDYLYANNEKYCNDGKWNLVDEYCALDALVELYKSTREYDYIRRGDDMATRIMNRLVAVDDTMGYLAIDDTGRPYFNAGEEGMPIVNLLNWYRVTKTDAIKERILEVAAKFLRFELYLTNKVTNPFGYAREYVRRVDGTLKDQFFFPHDTELAPWWQGENGRIASLATAARSLAELIDCEAFKTELEEFAINQINWILGLNPFDSCMLQGAGRNPIYYFYENNWDFIEVPGGIVNGITSGLHDDEGIEYVTLPNDEVRDNWRWAEQWVPHVTWYMYALAMKKR